ncbi:MULTISPECIES: amidohydrolase family protein [unclassified Devosia]|uniref:amidohydrolase family protein n=1 Tax=unclassified Devosia TaxID=196773 RepID=UPI00145FA2CE|nr:MULTISPECIES: amidohydrolase family protein [unclassified Devosia]MBJ6987875.1 amidohydrolase [Devosia sp. MC521]MBJ7576819.1 amidohydrolase [Devosia sp. MC532]MBK1796111.1 amidohydrolase [Devosia sp. WQ 349K1]QMW63779.1 amidohydrolase [Devosia sp. MC521]
MTVIDANMHWLPDTLFTDESLRDLMMSCIPRQHGIHVSMVPVEGKDIRQIIIEEPKGVVNINYAEGQYNIESQLADMDKAGIDQAVFRIPVWQEWLNLEASKRLNDGLAEYISRSNGRFTALAVCPPWGSKDMIREVERCVDDLGFKGVQLACKYGNIYLDDEAFFPYFEFLNDRKLPAVVHHTPLPVDHGSILTFNNMRRQYGRSIAQGTAIGRELFSGLFDRFPELRLSHSMLGGGFFAFVDMLVPKPKHTYGDAVDRFDTGRSDLRAQLRKNLFFDISGAPQWGKAQLECAIEVLGEDNILYGGSYPIRKDWFFDGVPTVNGLNVSDEIKTKVLSGNAKKLFNI